MKKYILMRLLRSVVSIFMVTTIVYAMVFTMVPRRLVFRNDPNYNKMATTPDKKTAYENKVFDQMGYIDYMNTKELATKSAKVDASVTVEGTAKNKKIYETYIKQLGNGWELKRFEESKAYYAVREIPLLERVFNFYANLIVIDHPWKVQDKSNPDLERYIRLENDPAIGWSVVGSGTQHKYLLYVNGQFPFIHQNFITLNLGTSYPTFKDTPVLQVITQGQGKPKLQEVNFPKGKSQSPVDIYSRTYKSPDKADAMAVMNYGKGDAYTATLNNYEDPSMLANSATIGLIALAIQYSLGLPLGMLMARYKNTLLDSVSTATLTFMMALPSIASVYVFRFIGSLIGLPDTFPILGASDFRSYILPAVILGLLSTPSMAIWMRRYLIDQQNSDYVRFARAKGLTEKEIMNGHILKNAMVPVVIGIPGAIILSITGATFTESVFAFPGMGKMIIDSVKAANNSMVVGLTFIFTVLAIISLLLGDIAMTLIDPRIKLSTKGGKK